MTELEVANLTTQAYKAQVENCKKNCLSEFSHINHFWDAGRHRVIAKILPGEFYTTTDEITIATTLGSCVSACIWDTVAKIGGMNHFMLPITEKEAHEVNWGQRGLVTDATRYGNYAMEHLINTILTHGGRRVNLMAKVFGGGKVLRKLSDVGERNIAFVLSYLEQENIPVVSSDLGAGYSRKILFEPTTGKAFVKKLSNLSNDTILRRETDYRSKLDSESVGGDIELF